MKESNGQDIKVQNPISNLIQKEGQSSISKPNDLNDLKE